MHSLDEDFLKNHKPVLLPFGETIYQTRGGQPVTGDTAFVVETVLQEFSNRKADVLELGSGNGIISIMLKHYRRNWQISGLEIQPKLIDLATVNAGITKLEINFLTGDLKEFSFWNKYDMIISNPPYFKVQDGRLSPNQERAISRHEIECDMLDVLKCIKRNLKEKGTAFLIYPENRMKDLEMFVKKVDLKIERKFISKADKKRIFVAKIVNDLIGMFDKS